MSITRRLGFNSPGRAFSESLLIMFGVLAALAVQSWWEDRVERAVLVSHLEAVRDELSEAETAIQKSLQHSGAVIDRTHAVLTVLAAPPTQHMPDTLMTTLSKMYVTRAASIPTRAYDAFANSSSFRLVTDRSLRATLTGYRNAIGGLNSATRAVWDVYYEVQLPFLNRHFVVSDFDWTVQKVDAFGTPIRSSEKLPESRYIADWEAINSREFWNLVYDWRLAYGDEISSAIEVQRFWRQLTDLLEEEIEQRERE